MESFVFKIINFDVFVLTIVNFLERFVKVVDCLELDYFKFEVLLKVRKFFNFKINFILFVY